MKSYGTEPRDEVNIDAVEAEEQVATAPAEGQAPAAAPDQSAPFASPPRRLGLRLPTREQWLNWAPFLGVLLLAALLRFWGLGDKPLHHDESLHAYFSMQLMRTTMENWLSCFNPAYAPGCYHYDPLLHGPFQFHLIAFVYKISQLLGAPDKGINTTTVRIGAATLGTAIVFLPYFLRDYLTKPGAWLASLLLAVSPSMVYFSRFAREDIYMAFFTLLLVVALARYMRDRRLRWLLIGAAALSFSYATKEATFLTIAVFGSFLGGLAVWELGLRWRLSRSAAAGEERPLRTWAPLLLLGYALVGGIVALIFFRWLHGLSDYITAHQQASDASVLRLENFTILLVPWLGILLGLAVLGLLAREMLGKLPPPGRRGLTKRVDPRKQRLLDALVTMPWTHWFFAILVAWAIFLVLYTALFTDVGGGIGTGIWQGIYYWIEQIPVARGGQPWYYYLLLIPLYEQVGVVFGIAGIVLCLLRPTRFRLFLVYWCVGNLAIYSWGSEKMPWLMIHITMPLMLLAAIALRPIVAALWNYVRQRFIERQEAAAAEVTGAPAVAAPRRVSGARAGLALTGLLAALLLLIPTLENMYQVSYVHAADGPHEMMVYVQTTPDVNIVMTKVAQLDQKYDAGQRRLSIGVYNDAIWPFIWYLRDYTNVVYGSEQCQLPAGHYDVIISGGDCLGISASTYQTTYAWHQYHMRSWWDEGYKPPPCIPSKANNNCAGQQTWGGVGPWLWLSYGDNPPPGAKFNPGLAAQRIWAWWWQRQPFGSTDGSYDMGLFIRKDLRVAP